MKQVKTLIPFLLIATNLSAANVQSAASYTPYGNGSSLTLRLAKPGDHAEIRTFAGSSRAGKSGTEIDFGKLLTFDRLEFTIDNPGCQRGKGRSFELQVRQPDGSWRTAHQGQVSGTIYAKAFAPVTPQQVRLNISGKVVQFDLFKK